MAYGRTPWYGPRAGRKAAQGERMTLLINTFTKTLIGCKELAINDIDQTE